MRHSEQVIQASEYHTCDICGDRMKSEKPCYGCGKDICWECRVFWDSDPFTGSCNGDYPPVACRKCNDLAEIIAKETKQIQAEADLRIDALIDSWKNECKQVKQ